jgi:ligand-binding sensor domain-containing protein
LGTLLFLLGSIQLNGQIPQLPVDAFSQNLNLSHPTCRSLAFDEQGFLWVGTDHGLNRFDGFQFRVYAPSVQMGTQHPWGRINALLRDENHTLWVGTASGLYRISTAPGKTLSTPRDHINLWSTPVQAMIHDPTGGIWVTSRSQVIHAQYDEDSQRINITPINAFIDNLRTDITSLTTEDGNLWVGTALGLFLITKDGTVLKKLELEHKAAITALLSTPGGLWIGAGTNLHFKPYKIDHIYDEPLDLRGEQTQISKLYLDKDDTLWISTIGEGLIQFNLTTRDIRPYRKNQLLGNLPDETIYDLISQDDGLLWLATQRAGLVRLQYVENRFERFIVEPYDQQDDRGVTAIFEDPIGNLWIGNQDGLVRQDATTGSIIHFFHDPQDPGSLPGETVQTILAEENGTLWVGTFRNGLARLAPGSSRFEHFKHKPGRPSGLPSNQVNALALDKAGTVWVGTRTGLVRYDQSKQKLLDWVNPGAKQGDPPLHVTALEAAYDGGLWFGTYHGFGRIRAEETELFINATEAQNQWPSGITFIMEDSVGQVWISAAEGLYRFSPNQKSLMRIPLDQVVPDQQIHGILEGQPGDLWLTSNYGLIQLRNGNFFRTYGPSAGLQSREFIQGAVFQSASGINYIGGPKGYNRFDPHLDYQPPQPPSVVLTSVRVMGKEVEIDLEQGLVLAPDQRFFTVAYSALDYEADTSSQFAFKLENSDDAWHFADSQRYVSFANLAGGTYKLHIRAANGENNWSKQDLLIPITVVPPFYATSSFQFTIVLLLLILVGIFLQYRVRHLRSRQQELQKLADQSTKSLYEAHARLAEDAHKAGVAEISTGVLHNIGNILNSVTVSTNALRRILVQSKLENFRKAVDMVNDKDESATTFFNQSRKGGLLAEFFLGAEEALTKENDNIYEETVTLLDQTALMGKAVSLEQSYANRFDKKIKVNMAELVDNAVRLQEMTLQKRQIELFKNYNEVAPCNVETFKLAHVITNLVRNAADALAEMPPPPEGRRIIVSVEQSSPEFVQVAIADNGIGISPENIIHMFSFGFTTKAHGNGFGLHSSHAIMQELGGSIDVESEGLGKGACFILQIPLESAEKGASK